MHKIIILTLLSLLTVAMANDDKMQFFPLDKPTIADLSRERESIGRYAKLVGGEFTASESDLAVIQAIIDNGLIKKNDAKSFEALGLILGDIIVGKYELEWVIIRDSYGTDVVLKPDNQEVSISAHSMILKRIEQGEKIHVKGLYDGLCKMMVKEFSIKERTK
jgi:hypothetical protein